METATLLSLGGIVVGVLGFAATLIQLSRVKSATDSAFEAVEGLKTRMSHLDALQEVAQADAAVSALRGDIKELSTDRWEHWSERLENALIVLAELADGGELGSVGHLSVATRQAAYVAKQADVASRDGTQARDKIREALRDVSRALVAVRAFIQRNQ